jgi:hypothetical protein
MARELAIGDDLLFNLTGRTAASRGRLTEVWVGPDSHKLAGDQQRERNNARFKERGLAGWIARAEGNELTIEFFSGPGNEYQGLFHDGPIGGDANLVLVDETLKTTGDIMPMKFRRGWLADTQTGVYGFRGARWTLDAQRPVTDFRPGQLVRAFDPNWAKK